MSGLNNGVVVSLRDVEVTFPGRHFPVLKGVAIQLLRGEVCAVTGPSGSGKTTLLNVVGSLLKPTRGEVATVSPESIGWVFQAGHTLGRRSVLDNVVFPLLGRGLRRSKAESRARDVLARVDLDTTATQPARSLSGGETQRLNLARALVIEPDLILADEPTGQLDATNTELVIDLLVTHLPAQSAALLVTHDSAVAQRCHRAYRLELGQVRAP